MSRSQTIIFITRPIGAKTPGGIRFNCIGLQTQIDIFPTGKDDLCDVRYNRFGQSHRLGFINRKDAILSAADILEREHSLETGRGYEILN